MSLERLFYLTTIPGLETAAHLELCDKWGQASAFLSLPPFPEVTFFKGGLEFKAPTLFGFSLIPHLRIPNRILLREKEFNSENERAFRKGIESIEWSNYFNANPYFDIEFSSRSSKLSMKKQIIQILSQELKHQNLSYQKGGQKIFIRIFRDQCNISFDCSGELQFKRGENKKVSIASLRETTAQGLLRLLLQGLESPYTLIDPMCGSGTFLNEALSINKELNRNFAFFNFKIYQNLKDQQLQINGDGGLKVPRKVYGFDINAKAIRLAQNNAKNFNSDRYHLEVANLFDSQGWESGVKDEKSVVVINPPWGKRLPGSPSDVLSAAYEKFKPQRLGILIPSHWKLNEIKLEKVRDIPILNSGVENRFVIFA